jgi:predicted metal-dependent phosphoesterase TrpH
MENKKCDLHIHSIHSDSDAELEDIFKKAQEKGLSCVAITDHDTVDGVGRAIELSKKYNIELIEAFEFSALYNDTEVHILGYFIDSKNEKLKKALAIVKEARVERMDIMMSKLEGIGVKVDKNEVFSKIKDNVPTRLHLGIHLLEKGIVKTLIDAFRKYLSPGKPAYVARFKYTAKEAVQLIKEAGGLAFLAHPHMLSDKSWIEKFVEIGIDGLEVVYPRFSEAKKLLYKETADKYGLLKSGGSDAHGSYKKFTNVGEVTIPYEWVEEMKSRVKGQGKKPVTSNQKPENRKL